MSDTGIGCTSVLDDFARVNALCWVDLTTYRPQVRHGELLLARLPGLEHLALPVLALSSAERWARADGGFVPLPYRAPCMERLYCVAARRPGANEWRPVLLPPWRLARCGPCLLGDDDWRRALHAAAVEVRRACAEGLSPDWWLHRLAARAARADARERAAVGSAL